ncbi:DUF418 domain-containing protein [Luteimonas sp. RIT-PG2_3]
MPDAGNGTGLPDPGSPALSSLPPAQRLPVLDALRGFALLGIFLMNIEWFSRPMQEMALGVPADATGWDYRAAWLVQVLVQGKFWVLFALLFGIGFALMARRPGPSADDGRGFRRMFKRRCAMLLVLGLAHAVLLWPGDILHLYALAGLLLLGMRGLSPGLQAGVGTALYAAAAVMMLAVGGLMLAMASIDGAALASVIDESMADATRAADRYAQGDFLAVSLQRLQDFLLVLQAIWLSIPMALGVFLIGNWLVASGRIDDIGRHRGFFIRLAAIALPLGIAMEVGALALGTRFSPAQLGQATIATAVKMAASLPLALAYLALFVLAFQSQALARVLRWLAPAGRMALSNYLLQSLLASSLFYGYGAGAWGQLGRAEQVLLVLLVFALQVLASHWWLSRHRLGPVEWLWRWWSHGVRPPMRTR